MRQFQFTCLWFSDDFVYVLCRRRILLVFTHSQCGLTVSLAQIDVGVAYAMWAAVGTATVSFCAMVLFAEDFDLIKIGCLIMIIVGVAGLNLRDEH